MSQRPDTFVEEANLTFNIQQLRKAFRDNARHPKFIETVARRGYRFIADVQEGTPPSVTTDELPNANPEVSLPTPGRSYFLFAAISVLLIGVVVTTGWFARGRLNASAESAAILSASFKSQKLASGGVALRSHRMENMSLTQGKPEAKRQSGCDSSILRKTFRLSRHLTTPIWD